MSFYSKIYSIKNIKVKVEDVTDVQDFMVSFEKVGLKVNTEEGYFIIDLDPNHESIDELTQRALAIAYSICESFDIGIEN